MNIRKTIIELLRPSVKSNESVRNDLHTMLPGMLTEQFASTLLENINVIVMSFVGNAAIAGVSQINPINNTLMIVFQAFSMGGTALVAQSSGAHRLKEGAKVAGEALLMGFAISLALSLGLFFLRVPMLHTLFGSAEPEVIDNSVAYYSYTALTPPLWFIYFQCCGFMRSCGDSKRPMFVSICINVMSILTNLFFTFYLQMGVAGAGLAYFLSVSVGAAIAVAMVMRKGFTAHPIFSFDRETWRRMKNLAHISVPSATENLLFNLTRLVVQVLIAGMGTAVISANQVFASVTNVLLIPFMSINFLVTPITGRCAGRGNDAMSVRSCVGYLYRCARAVAIWTTVAHLVLAVPLACLFCREEAVWPMAARMTMLYSLFVPALPGCFALSNGFKAVGDAKFAMFFSPLSAWVCRVGGMWLLGTKLGLGPMAVVLSQGADHLARHIAYKARFKSDRWLKSWESTADKRD